MMDIGFVSNHLEGTTQVILWDEASKTLLLKDSESSKGTVSLNDVCGHPAPEDVYTEVVENV